MKIIGRTESGARLVEITTEEIGSLSDAAQVLASITLEITPAIQLAKEPPDASPEPALSKAEGQSRRGSPEPARRVARHSMARSKGRARSPSAPSGSEPRLCNHCKQPLPKNAGANMRYHKECYKLLAREQARKAWRKNHPGCKPRLSVDRGPACAAGPADRLPNPADPFLTDEQRAALKAQRLATIKAVADKHKYDNAN
jgi:hypothetical protein